MKQQTGDMYGTYNVTNVNNNIYEVDIDAPANNNYEIWEHGYKVEQSDDDCCATCLCCNNPNCCLFCRVIGIICHGLSFLICHCPGNEEMWRAVCFGAIDGMLTGAGVVSAAVGLRIFPDLYAASFGMQYDLSHEAEMQNLTRSQQRHVMIALALAACCADGICMGVGHMWNSFVLQESSVKEKERELWLFHHHRDVSKMRLMENLMARGMRKVDAITIADTLEHYPEIFLGALTGDVPEAGGMNNLHTPHSNNHKVPSIVGFGSVADSGGVGSGRGIGFHEYAQTFFNVEYLLEGLIMMLTFAIFAVVPAIAHVYIPRFWNSRQGHKLEDELDIAYLHPLTVTMSCLTVVMLILGIWKSRFFGSSWFMFGLETVLVLYLCVFTAYSIGVCLRNFILEE